jgi:hypothetical protein
MPTPRKYSDRAERQRAYRQRQKVARSAGIRDKNLPTAALISSMPSTARWNALIQMARDLLQTAHQEMQTYREGRSEAWQESEKGEAFQDRMDRVEDAMNCIEVID